MSQRSPRVASRPTILRTTALVALLVPFGGELAHAGAIAWNGTDGDGLWSAGGNWDGGVAPIALDTVLFDLAGGDVIDHDAAAGTIYQEFLFGSGAGSFTFNGNAIGFADGGGITSESLSLQTFNVDITAAGNMVISARFGDLLFSGELSVAEDFVLTFEAGETITLSGFISGLGGVDITGGDTVIMSGATANTYTGDTIVSVTTLILEKDAGVIGNNFGASIQGALFINSGGTVQLGADHQISDSATVTVSGGTLDLDVHEETVGNIVFFGGGEITGDAAGTGLGLNTGAGILSTGTGSAEISANVFLEPTTPGDQDARIIDVRATAPLTISGVISDGFSGDGGMIEKIGTGDLTLTAANTYSGGTLLAEGTIFANNATALGTGDVTMTGGLLRGFSNIDGNLIQSGGEFRPDGDVTITIGGDYELSGGDFAPKEALEFIITGDLLIDGGAFIPGGETDVTIGGNLELNAGSFAPTEETSLSIAGDFTMDGGDFAPQAVINAAIAGNMNLLDGVFSPEEEMTLDIAGNLNIDGGDFTPMTSIDLIIGGNLELRSGLFSLGGGPTEVEIGGDFLMDGGTWQVFLNAAGESSLIIADTASLLSGTILAAPEDPINLVREYLIVQTANGIIGDPDDLEKMITNESFMLDFRLVLNGDDLFLRAIPDAGFGDAVAGSDNPNLPGIAEAMDIALMEGLGGTSMATLQMLDQAGVVRTLEQIQPQVYQATTEVLRRQQRVINAHRMSRLALYRSRLRDADRAVRRSALTYAGEDSAAVAAAVRQVDRYPNPVGEWNAWARVLNDFGRLNGDQAANRFSWHSHGVDVGAEKMISRELIIGGSIAGLWSDLSGREQSGDGESTSLFGNLYVGWMEGAWNFDAGLTYGHAWNDATRRMTLINLTAEQEYQSSMFGAFISAGHAFRAGDWDLEPYTSLEYSHVRDRGFTESGAGDFNLTVSREFTDSLRQSLGVRVAKTFESSTGRKFRPRANVACEVEYLDRYVGRTAAIFGNSFRTRGQETSRLGFRFGAGFDWIVRQNLAFIFDYDLTSFSESRMHTVNFGLRWQF